MGYRRTRSSKVSKRPLYSTITGVEPGHVPKKWVKFVAGIFLLLPCWILTAAFFSAVVESAQQSRFWQRGEFLYFAGGSLIGVAGFFFVKPLVWLYVIGHELTHALWVWLHGGNVHDFHVARDGGHIVTDKTNTLIVLAPYFFPFYTALWMLAYASAILFFGLPNHPELLQAGIGATWAFHMAYTISMVLKGQPDLEYGGIFFSIMVIYLFNLSIISALLVTLSPVVGWAAFGAELFYSAQMISTQIVQFVRSL